MILELFKEAVFNFIFTSIFYVLRSNFLFQRIVINIILFTSLIKLITKKNFKISLLIALIPFSFSILIDLIFSPITFTIMNTGLYQILSKTNSFISVNLVVNSMCLVLIMLLKLLFNKINFNFNKIPTNNNIINILIYQLIISSFISMFLCFQFLISPELIKSPIYFTFLFLLVILIILNVFLIYIVSTLDTKNNENKNLELQLNTVNILSDELREFKHNYLNILNSIGGYVNNNNMKDLKEYFQEVLNQADKIKYSNLFALTRLKISSISGILINTINKANKNNILLKLDISENVTLKTNFNLYNLSEIVGILFDNSIEAAVKTDEELVKITIQNIKDGLLIEISNSYNIEPDVSKIFNKGYSTKENPSGLGLYYVKKILKDYPLSSLNTEFENGLFKQSLFIK